MSPQHSQPTPERIMRFAWGYAPPLIMGAAVDTGIFDALDSGPADAPEVARRTGASERGVAAILDALTGMELLVKSDSGTYALTSESATFLVRGKPAWLGGMARHTRSQLIPRWLGIVECVRTGRAARAVNEESGGAEFFETFVADLFAMNYAAARRAAAELQLESATAPVKVVDLAAGSGVWSIAMAQSSPHVTVTAVDWERVLAVTRKTASRFGLSDRYTFVAGDLADADFGSGYNVATLGHILHSEGEESSRALLRKTCAALAPGGTIVIGEFLVNDDRRGPLQGLIFNVNMLVNTDHGAAFSFEQIRSWLEAAGFANARLVESPSPSPLIFATKPA